ncbi:hypothetical protein LUZ60_006048 [Juncus effusus]|nr:hypothetical protein LUZ60_006048 [Juncus effusus]
MSNMNNWLGFSLSPQCHVNGSHVATPVSSPSSSSSPLPCSFFLAPQAIPHPGFCYTIETENASLYSSSPYSSHHYNHNLSFMPLKSDGSLCIMEAFPKPYNQAVMQCQDSPKLEDFMGAQEIENDNSERETMSFLNLDKTNEYLTQNPRETSIEAMQMHQHQNPNYFSPLEGVVMYQPQLDWSGYSGLEHEGVIYGDVQSLNLSMSNGSHQSGSVSTVNNNALEASRAGEKSSEGLVAMERTGKKRGGKSGPHKQIVHRKSIESFGHRTSQYRGVTRHRWTGRYEAHLWDNSCKKEGQTRKGRQGGYDNEDKAARAYDLAAIKYWGPSTHINFPVETYTEELEIMKNMSRQEFIAHLRRRSSGFSRGASIYRGVTRHHQHGRWQARIGRVAGNKDLYLGTFSTQEEAAEAYDIAAIKFRGANAVTNFDITRYDVEGIMSSNALLPSELAKKRTLKSTPKDLSVNVEKFEGQSANIGHVSNSSSLVTSLSNSPERANNNNNDDEKNNNMVYSNEGNGVICTMVPVNSWNPVVEGHMRQNSGLAHLPVFAAWADV